jgi:hypothetical protein
MGNLPAERAREKQRKKHNSLMEEREFWVKVEM